VKAFSDVEGSLHVDNKTLFGMVFESIYHIVIPSLVETCGCHRPWSDSVVVYFGQRECTPECVPEHELQQYLGELGIAFV
jgi:hypothetical protein